MRKRIPTAALLCTLVLLRARFLPEMRWIMECMSSNVTIAIDI